MPEHRFDVFEVSGGASAFELVSDEEMQSAHLRDLSDIGGEAVEIAHAVSAKVAAELSGIPIALIEDRVVKYCELGVTNFSPGAGFQELEVRLNCDDRGT
jgi:hypothetical protein